MAERIVINSGPLISLARMDALDLLGRLPYDFLTPKEVLNELVAGPADLLSHGLPTDVEVVSIREPPLAELFRNLDSGEAAVIQLALENKVRIVCIDESKGRKVAVQRGLFPLGSLGLLGRAKSLQIIGEIKPFITMATAAGVYYDETLITDFLQTFGESW